MKDGRESLDAICPHCGAAMREYWHRLNRPLCSALLELYWAGGHKAGVNICRMDDLTYSQKSNFQKLKYWEFVEKDAKSTWRITPFGVKFVRGLVAMHESKRTYRQRVTGERGRLVKIFDVVDSRWKGRDEYLEEK